MKKLFLFVLTIGIAFAVHAQKTTGDISCLKGQNQINISFNYEGVTYDGDSESKYFKSEDLAKKADWRAAWTSTYRTEKWEPRLTEDINKEIAKKKMECGDFPEATYTIIVKLVDIDPGSFAGPMSVPAKITANAIIINTVRDVVRCRFDDITGISHGYTDAGELKHINVVFPVAEDDDILDVGIQVLHHVDDALILLVVLVPEVVGAHSDMAQKVQVLQSVFFLFRLIESQIRDNSSKQGKCITFCIAASNAKLIHFAKCLMRALPSSP